MDWKEMESSQIARVAYAPDLNTLWVDFKPTKKQTENGERGSMYTYENVPQSTFDALLAAESVGKYFTEHIKKHPEIYPYVKVTS